MPALAAAVIPAVIGGVSSAYNAHESNAASTSNVNAQIAAQEKAQALEQKARDEALAFQRAQIVYQNEKDRLAAETAQKNYDAAQSRQAPYVQAGNAAFAKLGDLKGLSGLRLTGNASQMATASSPAATTGGLSSVATQTAPAMPPASTATQGPQAGVKMIAPNGETQVVPFDQVAHYLAQGAKKVA